MSSKFLMMASFTVGSIIGSYAPMLFTSDIMWSFIGGTIGGIVGIWVGWKLMSNM